MLGWRGQIGIIRGMGQGEDQVLIQWSVDYIREYQMANEIPVIAKNVGCQSWIPPADPVYEVNVDGVIFQTKLQAGIGVIVRDSQGMCSLQ